MNQIENSRGFSTYEFSDANDRKCSIQESSSVDPRIWLGLKDQRMHLDVEGAKKLLPYIAHFVQTGGLDNVDPDAKTYTQNDIRDATVAAYVACEQACLNQAEIQALRAESEGNDYARERRHQAIGCARIIEHMRNSIITQYETQPEANQND